MSTLYACCEHIDTYQARANINNIFWNEEDQCIHFSRNRDGQFRCGKSARCQCVLVFHSECEHTVLTSLLIVTLLADIIHQRWIHDPRFYSFQDVQEEETSCYARILKRAN